MEGIAMQLESLRFQLILRPKQVRVVRHVEHALEPDLPGVFFRQPLFNENWDLPIDRFRYLRISFGTEDGARTSVRINQRDLLGAERKVPVLIFQICDMMCKKEEIRSARFNPW